MLDRFPGFGIDARIDASGIITVKTKTSIEVKLGFSPGTENKAELWTCQTLGAVTVIFGKIATGHIKTESIEAR